MNSQLPVLLLALLAANRFRDTPGDSSRVALLAMAIKPPMMGLLVALLLAKQQARTNVIASNAGVGTVGIHHIVPKIDHRVFPDFLNLTRKQAEKVADEFGLTPNFVDFRESGKRETVVRQDPKEGTHWPVNVTEVTLYLG